MRTEVAKSLARFQQTQHPSRMKRLLPFLALFAVSAFAAGLSAATPDDRPAQNYLQNATAFSSSPKWAVVGFGLVFGSMALAWIAAIVLGGFKIGSLERRVEYRMTHDEYAPFWERMRQRLTQIGFVPGPEEGVFGQSGAQFGDMSSFTHAKTKKELRATAFDNGQGITVEISLRYLDPIVGDTGESAYRDSVLDFISGTSDGMKTVTNRSYGALSSFIGGIVACLALVVMKLIGYTHVLPPILMLTIAEVVTAIMAILAIRSKPGELTGLWLAIAGIGLSALATLAAVAFEVMAVL